LYAKSKGKGYVDGCPFGLKIKREKEKKCVSGGLAPNLPIVLQEKNHVFGKTGKEENSKRVGNPSRHIRIHKERSGGSIIKSERLRLLNP